MPSSADWSGAIGILLADGRLPTGGHAHSVGLEWAARLGEVHDVGSLTRFVEARLDTQGRVDAAFAAAAAHAWRAAHRNERLGELITEFDARTLSPHLRDSARTLGRHLARAARSIVPDPTVLGDVPADSPRPIVAGAVAAEVGLAPTFAAALECHHLASTICSAAVKLLGLDPLAIVGVQAALAERIDAIAAAHDEPRASCDLVAATSSRAEILAEWHAADTSRLFAT